MLARLDGVLLGRQAKGVKPERMEDAVTLHAQKPGVDIRSDIAERMPDVETGARRVGKHVEHVERITAFQTGGAVGEGP